jgi:hypothetical protein
VQQDTVEVSAACGLLEVAQESERNIEDGTPLENDTCRHDGSSPIMYVVWQQAGNQDPAVV